ncbi:MAG: septal ring lytic transglycosylase RlpA family protein [Terriglobia bacterium]
MSPGRECPARKQLARRLASARFRGRAGKKEIILLLILLLGEAGLSGCAKKKVHVAMPTASPTSSSKLDETVGYASWYGDPYHGRRTSNGEIYNKNDLTAAHRTLPFDSIVKVNNLDNGKQVTVRINDRGPFVNDRIIDLSYAAARSIDMVGPGTAKVQLAVLKVVPNPYPIAIQVGSFRDKNNALQLEKQLSRSFSPVQVEQYKGRDGKLFRVMVGRFKDEQEAAQTRTQLKKMNLNGLLVRLEK